MLIQRDARTTMGAGSPTTIRHYLKDRSVTVTEQVRPGFNTDRLTRLALDKLARLVALFLSGYTLSFTAVIGFIALIGIEVKNSILPLVLERSSLYSPLALVSLGGLVSSPLLARLLTPVLYKLLPPELEADEPVARPVAAQGPVPAGVGAQ